MVKKWRQKNETGPLRSIGKLYYLFASDFSAPRAFKRTLTPVDNGSRIHFSMKMSNTFSLVVGSLLLIGLPIFPNLTSAGPSYAPLVASNTDFALNLYGQIAATNDGNICFSPLSISACFGMAYAGANGETAQEMALALDFSTNQSAVASEFGALQVELNAQQGTNGVALSVVNGLWAQTNYPFLPSFLDNAISNYDANVQEVNFMTNAAGITDQINEWVADETDGMISNLLASGTLNRYTRLALVNAIYFKAQWGSQFATNLTILRPFHTSSGQTVNVPLMEQEETVPYYEDSLLQAIELPYTNSNLGMVVLLPKNTNGLPSLSLPEWQAVVAGLTPQATSVFLPRFTVETATDLVPILQNMGMIDAFIPDVADFSGIDGARDLSIDAARHQAVVQVDEAGTEAAGATVVTFVGLVIPPFTFRADHPFLFLICDTNSGSILFVGSVVNPASNGGSAGPSAPNPLIQTGDGSFGINSNQFGFNVAGTNLTLVVEACTNIATGGWFPVQTLTLSNGSAYFSEPWSSSNTSRYYRVHSQ
jgi:serpin B